MKNNINNSKEVCAILKNLANEKKLAILCYLWTEEKNVWELLNSTEISQSQLSQFLAKMKLEGILSSEKKWKEVYYKIVDLKTLEIIKSLKNIFNK